jgi:hypothetical protein
MFSFFDLKGKLARCLPLLLVAYLVVSFYGVTSIGSKFHPLLRKTAASHGPLMCVLMVSYVCFYGL